MTDEKLPLIHRKRDEKEIMFDWFTRDTRYETWDSENTDITFGQVHDGGVEIRARELRHYHESDRYSDVYISSAIPGEQVDQLIDFLIRYRNESQGKRYIDAKKEGVSPEAKDQVEIAWKALSQINNYAGKGSKVEKAYAKIALDAMEAMKAVNK
jgi:hypothetical protein